MSAPFGNIITLGHKAFSGVKGYLLTVNPGLENQCSHLGLNLKDNINYC